jgi:tRNA 2-thiocytidine biosynthesis protein TtcA
MSQSLPLLSSNVLPIACPPWSKLGKKLESAIRKAIFDFHLFDGVNKLALALSGGKDSLTLLFLLKAIVGKGLPPLDITAINVTGAFTCGASISSEFLKAICQALEVPLIQVESQQKRASLECYSCSRKRRKLLFDAAKSVGATAIAFGHHRDDNTQTVLMNLLHKGEFAGMLPKVAMHRYDMTIIRPLIYLSEENIRAFAQYYGFARITCSCPVGQTSLRRKTDQLLQELEAFYPNARANIAKAVLLYGSKKALDIP